MSGSPQVGAVPRSCFPQIFLDLRSRIYRSVICRHDRPGPHTSPQRPDRPRPERRPGRLGPGCAGLRSRLVNGLEAVAVFGAGVGAGAINTIVGSGSLITFPTLVALGYPPIVANVS